MYMTWLLAAALSLAGQDATIGDKAPDDAAYLVSKPGVLREKPEATSTVIAKVAALDIGLIERVTTGWLLITLGRGEDAPPVTGWIQGSPDDILPEKLLDVLLRKVRMNKAWPIHVKLDILRQRPRIGFTKEQVIATLDEPNSKTSEETAAGVTELWTYVNAVHTFKGDKLSKIQKVQ